MQSFQNFIQLIHFQTLRVDIFSQFIFDAT